MGTLKVGALDFNEIATLKTVRAAIVTMARRPDCYHDLRFKRPSYFRVPQSRLPSEAGWYIILDGTQPIYVGKSANLNSRLNTDNGSRDNFCNHKRAEDAERNFIKKFIEIGAIQTPRVCIIRRSELASAVGISEAYLTKTDAGNIEKFINLMRNGIAYL